MTDPRPQPARLPPAPPPAPPLALVPTALLAASLVAPLAGCAGNAGPPSPVRQAGSPLYRCPDGSSFTRQFDPDTHQTDLFLTGGTIHRLDPVPDPLGGTLYQDADWQLRTTGTDQVAALTDRSTTLRRDCTRATLPGAAP